MRKTLFLALGLGALALAGTMTPAERIGDGYTRLAQTCPAGHRYDYRTQSCIKE